MNKKKSKIQILSSLFIFSIIYQGILLSSYPPSPGPDGADFLRLGYNLKTSGRFALFADGPLMYDRVPGYPLFISLCSLLPGPFPDLHKVIAGQVLLTAFSSVFIGLITALVLHWRWTLIAGLIFTCYRGTIFCTSIVSRETLTSFFLYMAILFALWLRKKRNVRPPGVLIAGMLFGLAILCREDIAGYAPLTFLLIAAMPPESTDGHRFITGCFFICGIIIAMSPWATRNYVKSGQVLILSTAAGTELYAGNNEHIADQGIDYGLAPRLRKQSTLDAFATDRKYREAALGYMIQNPSKTWKNFINKIQVYILPKQLRIDAYCIIAAISLTTYIICLFKGLVSAGPVAVLSVPVTSMVLIIFAAKFPFLIFMATGSYSVLFLMGVAGCGIAIKREISQHWYLPAMYVMGILIAGIIIPQFRQRYVLDGILCVYACVVIELICTKLRKIVSVPDERSVR